MAKHNETGRLGEDIACNYLKSKGFNVLDRNYRKIWGEIDIVAKKRKKVHFVEVKTVSRDLCGEFEKESRVDCFKPEDNIHPWKLKRLSRVIQTYVLHKKIVGDWQFDVLSVLLDQEHKIAKVTLHNNVIL